MMVDSVDILEELKQLLRDKLAEIIREINAYTADSVYLCLSQLQRVPS